MLLILAWRNLWRNKKRTLITISSVVFAVVFSTLADSAGRGSWERMIENMVKFDTGYIQVQDVLYKEEPSIDNSLLLDEQLRGVLGSYSDKIEFMVPRLQNFALAAGQNQTRGVMVVGIDPEAENKLNQIKDKQSEGDFITKGDRNIVMARGLSEIMHINVGDSLVLLGQGFQGSTASGIFRVKGIVNHALPDMNNNMVYMSIDAAQWFYNATDRLTSLILMPNNPDKAKQLARELKGKVDGDWYAVLMWEEILEEVIKFMKFDLAGTLIFMLILYIVIAFGIFGTVLTMMMERQREFGMLISLGMSRSKLAMTCLIESIFISSTGVIIGLLVAIPITLIFHYNPIPIGGGELDETFNQFGFEPVVPFSIAVSMYLKQALIVLGLSLLVGLYPVYKVFNLNIMKVRR